MLNCLLKMWRGYFLGPGFGMMLMMVLYLQVMLVWGEGHLWGYKEETLGTWVGLLFMLEFYGL